LNEVNMAPLELKNVKTSTIEPSEKSNHPATLYASLLDLSGLDAYVTLVLFYRPRREGSVPGSLISNLKESLSKVLVPYYPFAGDWVRTYDSKLRELKCTDEGVPFVEAYVDQEMKSVLNNGNFQHEPQLSSLELFGLDSKIVHQEADIPMPALIVKVRSS
jgi:hypothetical protein